METPKLVLYLFPNFVVTLVQQLDMPLHQHHTHQVTLAVTPIPLVIDGTTTSARGVLIGADMPHATGSSPNPIINFLFEPETDFGQRMTARLANRAYLLLDEALIDALMPLLALFRLDEQLPPILIHSVHTELIGALADSPGAHLGYDARIEAALEILRRIPEKRAAARAIASQVALSETRFTHLFKDQLGTTFRALLLWLRFGRALQHVWSGKSLTQAAHAAGFADSAHLSRTSRQMFGRPLSQLFGTPGSFRVYSYLEGEASAASDDQPKNRLTAPSIDK
jgi:AraC-like DNA-binding protein